MKVGLLYLGINKISELLNNISLKFVLTYAVYI